ncbi:MAG: hypothetical protein HRU19_26250 [Pseudobacteriovorax sp.]|nr:hypothetical protein [Pseudobacteriovorax sp.]
MYRNTFMLLVSYFALSLLVAGCDEFAAVEDPMQFGGVQKVVANHDGTYTLNWVKVPSDEVSYAIYIKDGVDAEWSMDTPEDVVKSGSYISKNLSFVDVPCFLVKDIGADGYEGENEKTICASTRDSSRAFAGVETLKFLPSGRYQLGWSDPFGEGHGYEIFVRLPEQSDAFEFAEPLARIKSNEFITKDTYLVGQIVCFVVRAVPLEGGEKRDENTNERCSEEVPADRLFPGVSSAEYIGNGQVKVTWNAQPAVEGQTEAEAITGYGIYGDTDFSQQIALAGAETTEFIITGLVAGNDYYFGVRSINGYDLQDANTNTIKVKIPDDAAPEFDGARIAKLNNTEDKIRVEWQPAKTVVKEYRVYLGAAYRSAENNTLDGINCENVLYTSTCKSIVDFTTPAQVLDPDVTSTEINVQPGDDTAYFIAVRAVGLNELEESNSNIKKVNIADGGAPIFVGVSNVTIKDEAILISWEAPVGEVSDFKIRIRDIDENKILIDRDTTLDGDPITTKDYFLVTSSIAGVYRTSNQIEFAAVLNDNDDDKKFDTQAGDTVGFRMLTDYEVTVNAIDRHGNSDTNKRTFIFNIPDNIKPEIFTRLAPGPRVIVTPTDNASNSDQIDIKIYRKKTMMPNDYPTTEDTLMAYGLGETIGVDNCTDPEPYRTYLIQATDPTGNTATAVASSLCQDMAPAGFVKVPKERTGFSYDYYIMSFEAGLSDTRGIVPGDEVSRDAGSLSRCSYQFHREGVDMDSSCGRLETEVKAISQQGITPARGLTFAQAYAACRNASSDQFLVRLPTRTEWLKAADWLSLSYETRRATYANVCNIKTANLEVSGDRSTCRNDINVYDVAGNLSEYVDEQIINGSTLPNGIDHSSRSINGEAKALYMGASFNSGITLNAKIGVNVEGTVDMTEAPNFVGFRCIAFARNSTPTMAQMAKPHDVSQQGVAVTDDEDDKIISWNPWQKATCQFADDSCVNRQLSDTGITYEVYRFKQAPAATYSDMPWVVQSDTYMTAKPLNPLARNAMNEPLYDEDTEDGKLIATITDCDGTQPEFCSFTDGPSSGTGFNSNLRYWYGVQVIDQTESKDFAINYPEGQFELLGGAVGDDSMRDWGTQGVSAPENWPGYRYSTVTWTDQDGNLWLFGGSGRGDNDGWGRLNDLWRYDPKEKEWTWVHGSKNSDQNTIVTTGPLATPGARQDAVGAIDSQNNLWLYGGYGRDVNGGTGRLADLWKFDTATSEWTFVSGTQYVNRGAVGLGSFNAFDSSHHPGGRSHAAMWADGDDNLYVLGGYLHDGGRRNDLWKYETDNNRWAWIGGKNFRGDAGSKGVKGIEDSSNWPRAGEGGSAAAGNNGYVWFYGGVHHAGGGIHPRHSALWRYNTANNQWTWYGGDETGLKDKIGIRGIPEAGSIPGGISRHTLIVDGNDNIWLIGGYGHAADSESYGTRNTMWVYDHTNWRFMGGYSLRNEDISGPKYNLVTNSPHPENKAPGSYHYSAWIDLEGDIYYLDGVNKFSRHHRGTDFWKYYNPLQ